jgi:acetate kinase
MRRPQSRSYRFGYERSLRPCLPPPIAPRRRGPTLKPVLTVNAGSTSLKLHLVDGQEARPVDTFVPAEAVGHRVVHGGAHFVQPTPIDDDVIRGIEELRSIAPLHNDAALRGIQEARAALPDVPHVAVFDTAFHRTIPAEAATYAIPRQWHEEWGIRRYGFHGLAVESVVSRVDVERLVVCHLGGGCSITAVLRGESVDTTMGFTPLEGVPMATRSGSIDPGALLFVLREKGLTTDDLDRALEHESGLAALGGLDDPDAFAVFTYAVACAAARMAVALGGIDVLAFSGGVGENRPDVRDAVAERLAFLGNVRLEVVEAREELVIAQAVRGVLGQ